MSGKVTKAPCGHKGEHVFGNFVVCLEGCDSEAVPEEIEPEKTEPLPTWFIHIPTGWKFIHIPTGWK